MATQQPPGEPASSLSAMPVATLSPDRRPASIRASWLALMTALLICAGIVLFFLGPDSPLPPGPMPTVQPQGTLIYFYHTSRMIYPIYINGCAWSQNNRYLACATGDNAVRVLDVQTRRLVFTYRGHRGHVNNVVWLPNGRQVASVSSDHTVQIWDALTGEHSLTFPGSSSLWSVSVAPSGTLLAFAGQDGQVELWQITPRKYLSSFTAQMSTGGIWGLDFCPAGNLLASGDSSGTVDVWQVDTGKLILTYLGQKQQIFDVKWSTNGLYLASASQDGTVIIWNALTGRTLYIQHFPAALALAVSWSPGSRRIAASTSTGMVHIFDAFDGRHSFVYAHHSGQVYTVAWSPDGRWIASGDESGSVQVWVA